MDIITTYGGLWKELLQFLLFFFFLTKSTNYVQDIFLCNTKVSQQPGFSLRSLKLNLSSRLPWHQPFPSPPRLWEMSFSLLKMSQQWPFWWASPWEPCHPNSFSFHYHRCQPLFLSGLPDLSWFCLPPTYTQTSAHSEYFFLLYWAWTVVSCQLKACIMEGTPTHSAFSWSRN